MSPGSPPGERNSALCPPRALFDHAARTPHRPLLFFRRGWDWRWIDFAEAAGRVAAAAEALGLQIAELGEENAGEALRIGFAYFPEVAPLLLDLALQAAGAVAAPVACQPDTPSTDPASEIRRRGLTAWAATLGEGEEPPAGAPAGLPRLNVAASLLSPSPGSIGTWPAPVSATATGAAAGGVLVTAGDGFRVLTHEELAAAAGELAAALAGVPVPPRREIIVSWRPLDQPAERVLVTWALAAGAALVLEPHPLAAAATAAWVRPTVLHVGPGDLAPLRRAAEGFRPPPFGRRELPFGRLHTLLWSAPGEPPAADLGDFESRGVRLRRLPVPG